MTKRQYEALKELAKNPTLWLRPLDFILSKSTNSSQMMKKLCERGLAERAVRHRQGPVIRESYVYRITRTGIFAINQIEQKVKEME